MNISFDIENKDQVIQWLERLKQGTDNAIPLWMAMTPKITEFVNYQFDPYSDKGKGWRTLTANYIKWKAKKGFYRGIGTMTGLLRQGAGEKAKKTYREKELIWEVDQGLVQNKKGTQYAGYFDKKRPIYKRVAVRINSFLGIDIKKFEGKSRNSFTYLWLRNSLRELQK